jgi:DNA ligase D-like protein (predicted polymerase)
MPAKAIEIDVEGTPVRVSNPDKLFWPDKGYTKLDLLNYYLSVGPGVMKGIFERPMTLKRFPNGAGEDFFFQKRSPSPRPPGVENAVVHFPSGRSANLTVCDTLADLAWVINLGCIDLNPWPVRYQNVNRPDELRIDLDPTPEATWDQVRQVALTVNEVMREYGYTGFPKTSGSRGIHIYVRLEPRWGFGHIRRSVLALGREVERRIPALATTKWWKEERHGVFIDYNQNARDRTVASVYSVRPTPNAQVSCPVTWEELPGVELADFTIETVPPRFAEIGDPGAGVDDVRYSLEPLLDLVAIQERAGEGDAPWPPQFPKGASEPRRVQPSRRKAD